MSGVHWLYPVNERSDYWLDGIDGQQLKVTPENVWEEVRADPARPDSWYLSNGYKSMRPGDRLWIYAAGRQFIFALGQVTRVERHRDGTWHAIVTWDAEATDRLRKAPISRGEFKQIPQSPCRAAPSTARILQRWLKSEQIHRSAAEDEPVSNEDARLKVLAEIVRRQGQGQFRRDLIATYGGKCCATGETVESVLEAAHIIPYLGQHSQRLSNGLLLRADIHTLFDLYMISVDANGKWVVSSRLDGTTYEALRGRRPRKPTSNPPSKTALSSHFARFRD